jgi:hypothetical protein
MTNNGKTGDIAPFTKEEYETGISKVEAETTASDSNEEMRLTYANENQRNPDCTDYLLTPDRKYFFTVTRTMG